MSDASSTSSKFLRDVGKIIELKSVGTYGAQQTDELRAELLLLSGSIDMPLTRAAIDALACPSRETELAHKYLDYYRQRWRAPDATVQDLLNMDPHYRGSFLLQEALHGANLRKQFSDA